MTHSMYPKWGPFGKYELWKLRVGVRAANSQLLVVGDPQE